MKRNINFFQINATSSVIFLTNLVLNSEEKRRAALISSEFSQLNGFNTMIYDHLRYYMYFLFLYFNRPLEARGKCGLLQKPPGSIVAAI